MKYLFLHLKENLILGKLHFSEKNLLKSLQVLGLSKMFALTDTLLKNKKLLYQG
jgi:hypothetical protein